MRLIEALVELEKGKNVRRKCWEPDMYILKDINNNYVTCNGVTYIIDDFNSNDWEVIDTRKEVDVFWKLLYNNLEKIEPLFKNMIKKRQCHQHYHDHNHHFRECRNCIFEEACEMYTQLKGVMEDLNKSFKLDILPFDKEEHDHDCHDKFEDHRPERPNNKEEHDHDSHDKFEDHRPERPNNKEEHDHDCHDKFEDHRPERPNRK